jgi:hypothetical protein
MAISCQGVQVASRESTSRRVRFSMPLACPGASLTTAEPPPTLHIQHLQDI